MSTRIVAIPAAMLTALILAAGTGGQAAALTAEQSSTFTSYADCPLERIGDQFVRCDNLTGAGVKAPFWIPEQS
ncbi:hypothetical protein FJ661_15840 [Pseudarthrobacter phenanthrenivorans]|uniref:hypothetical protein n=1 Tax=Pseudarthrobacter phenanthrenivorans TaxID=361575 RepID=UPI00112709FC|nr:hypothetical protein [Pseudarthrobacter phenanthrenivorans]TPV49412.1 hypothetical protein FJ661_15840 [Pseudarthrobacter phenanthrenivorans]